MSIYKKLFEAKKEIGVLTKDAKNPFFKSNYLSLNGLIDAVEIVLEKHDLILLQPITSGFVCTKIFDIETADVVMSEMQLPNIQDPQKLGSAITYYRRYTLQSLLGLQAEDDDGNSSTKQVKEERKPALTEEQFKTLQVPANKAHIQSYLDKCRMSATQRETLTKIIK